MAGETNKFWSPEMEAAAYERARIAEWLNAKADETEELLILAAERGDPTAKATQLWFAKKTRIVISVLASMVEQNTLALRAKGETP